MRTLIQAIVLPLLLSSVLSSCASRTFCSTEAPRLPRGIARPSSRLSEPQRISAYTTGHEAADGFRLRRVDAVRVQPSCGLGLFKTIFTVGLVPTQLPCNTEITVTGEVAGQVEQRHYLALLHSWSSAYHGIIPQSHDDVAVARGLLEAVAADRRVTVRRRR